VLLHQAAFLVTPSTSMEHTFIFKGQGVLNHWRWRWYIP